MKALAHAGIACAVCAWLAGCAVLMPSPDASTPAERIRAAVSAQSARDAITIGKSTRAEVLAALGKTQVIRFDSGFEVWVYRYLGDAPATAGPAERSAPAASARGASGQAEFVVLFAPSGVVAKTRVRPVPERGKAKSE